MTNLPNSKTASMPLCQEQQQVREWIAGRALTLLSHYYRDDDPVQLSAALGKDWVDVLEGIPQEFIQKACIRYMQSETRKKPTPGSIFILARSMMPPPQKKTEPEPVPKKLPDRATREKILREAGFNPNGDGWIAPALKKMDEPKKVETIPEMRQRHKAEIRSRIDQANDWGVPQSVAAETLGMSTRAFNNLLRRCGIEWKHPREWRRTDLRPREPFTPPESEAVE